MWPPWRQLKTCNGHVITVVLTHALLNGPAQTDATLLANNTLLDATFCVRLHTLLHVFACYWAKFETDQTLEPATPNRFFCSVIAEAWRNNVGSVCTALTTLGSLRNDDDDGNENGKKAIGLDKQNNNFARASHSFVHFCAVVAQLQRETPNFTFCRGRNKRQQFSFSLPELWCNPLKFNSNKFCQHLTI